MRVLHTSDWHLGQKFIGQSRDAEHEAALAWLLQVIENEQVECLIVAGDIFDVNNPPVSAEEIYYRFLTRLVRSESCRHVVVVGGNHDLPSRLNAPAGLLRALNVHVVGCASDDVSDEIIELKNEQGEVVMLIAAVPFLRDKDLKISVSGESTDERIGRIQAGIVEHYRQVANQINQSTNKPIIATGHLHATGASSTGEQRNIYIGNLDNIAAEQFPDVFDYIALGHIHRPQKVGKRDHIRYCGSLIPLSFSELEDRKLVLLLDFVAGKKHPSVREIEVPIFRKLVSLHGTLAEVELGLQKIGQPEIGRPQGSPLPAWVEIVVENPQGTPNLDFHLREKAAGLHLEILRIKNERPHASLDEAADPGENLDNLRPEDVFRKKIEQLPEFEQAELVDTFRELNDWLQERNEF